MNQSSEKSGLGPSRLPVRYHDLDALRAFAMLLGIVLHGLMSFIEIPMWPAQDRFQNSEVCGIILSAIHGFRLPLFFLISGFFTTMLWRKRGLRRLIKHRAVRILVPLIAGTIVTWLLIVPISVWGEMSQRKLSERNEGWITDPNSESVQSDDLCSAAKIGDVERISQMLGKGSNTGGRDSEFGIPALAWAVMSGQAEAVEVMIGAGADVNLTDREGSGPLHVAVFFGQAEAAGLLLVAGAKVNAESKKEETPLDSLQHGWMAVQWVAEMLEVEVDRKEVMEGRKKVEEMLRSAGGKRNGVGGDRGLVDLWAVGAKVPVFYHLWFLYYLCWLVVLFSIAVLVGRWIPWRLPDLFVSTSWRWAWLVPLPLLAQLFMTDSFGPDTATGILPWPPKLLYYATFFGFGAMCFGRPFFVERGGEFWPVWLALGIVAFVGGLYFFDQRGDLFGWKHWVGCLLAVCFAWLMIFGCIGLFRRCFDGESRWIRYVSDSAYWLYLAHLPLVMALQVWVSGWILPISVKVLIVCGTTTIVLLLIYEIAVRYTWIGALLNGRKTRA